MSGIPKLLRSVSIGLVIIGALFKHQHWPWAEIFLVSAWPITLVAMVWRPLHGLPVDRNEAVRDVFAFAMISVVVMRMMHLPGKGYALALAILSGLVLLWSARDRILPGGGDGGTKPWLFYPALALVLTGTLFRIQHWPFSTTMIIGGLALAAFWFFTTMNEDRNGK